MNKYTLSNALKALKFAPADRTILLYIYPDNDTFYYNTNFSLSDALYVVITGNGHGYFRTNCFKPEFVGIVKDGKLIYRAATIL